MKQVFTAYNLSDVYFVKTLLEAEGIPSIVRNEQLLKGQATKDGYPSVWILDEDQCEAAASIVSRYLDGKCSSGEEGHSWKCPKCGETHEAQFSTCWQCGAEHS